MFVFIQHIHIWAVKASNLFESHVVQILEEAPGVNPCKDRTCNLFTKCQCAAVSDCLRLEYHHDIIFA